MKKKKEKKKKKRKKSHSPSRPSRKNFAAIKHAGCLSAFSPQYLLADEFIVAAGIPDARGITWLHV